MQSTLRYATAAAVASFALAGPASADQPEIIALESLDVPSTLNLLKNWGVTSLLESCSHATDCTGRLLVDMVESLQHPQAASTGESAYASALRYLKTTSGADLFGLTQKVSVALSQGGVDAALVEKPSVAGHRRRLASSSGSGVQINADDAVVVMGSNGDVMLQRTGARQLTIDNDLVVNGDSTFNTTTAASMTVQGHLEVDQTISTGYGRITRDFHQYYVRSSDNRNPAYYNMKTSIPVQENIMYRLEILGYAYGESANIDSVTTGYTYHGWDCVNNEDHVDFGDGAIDVYCDAASEYLVLEFYLPDWYYTGLTVSGWFLNPNGNAHDIEVLDTIWTTTNDYWASNSRRGLEDEDDSDTTAQDLKAAYRERDVTDEGRDDVAEPVQHKAGAPEKRFSLKDLMGQMETLQNEVKQLRETVQKLTASGSDE
eukprot:INCI4402.1.p1 GENE.INCI4402.1~~INCI4402.1.p1  ORF type:complete len:430 (-),score=86.44 INCI4402.1:139-1428(-)